MHENYLPIEAASFCQKPPVISRSSTYRHELITAYHHPKVNNFTERLNRTLMDMLSQVRALSKSSAQCVCF